MFTNDCYVNGEDRNLYVDYIVVDGQTIQAEGGAGVIDKGGGSAAFDDVNVVVGQENIAWNGSLRIAVGKGAFAGGYDANGNMTVRVVNGKGQVLSYDAENRLVEVKDSLNTDAFSYDGDGKRVKADVGNVVTYYVGNYFEWTGSTSTMVKYYSAGGSRVAMRIGSSTMYYLLADHLGGTNVTVTTAGVEYGEVRYRAFGETRYSSGTTPTTFRYTGQREEASIGLYYYGARWYDPYLNRWTQIDTIIPLASQGVQAWDRYAFVNNNPVRWNDPSGHEIPCGTLCNFWKQLYDSVMQSIGRTYVYENNQADNVGELMVLAFFQEPSAEITGDALNDISSDKTLLAVQNSRVEEIRGDPRYGKEDFSLDFGIKPITFGEMGNDNMFEDATHSQTWTVRAANVSTVAQVSTTGEITFNYELNDRLDLRPDWFSGMRTGFSGFGYNVITTITGAVWHDFLGAREMDTHASWTYTVEEP